MARFQIANREIELRAVQVAVGATDYQGAWERGTYVTVKLLAPVSALRVHTDGRQFPGRSASRSFGKWVLLGDVILTASQLADNRSLPTDNPNAATAFTQVNEARIPANCVINIGIASRVQRFGGNGGGFQGEYVSGPKIQFTPLRGKHWHSRAGLA